MCQSAETALRCCSKCLWPVNFPKDHPGMCYKKVPTELFTFSRTRKSHPNPFLLSPFFWFFFFGFGNRWTSIVWTKNSTTRHASLQAWNSFIDDTVPLVLNKLNKLSSTCKIYTLISGFRGGTTLNQGDMYLLLSRYRSFSTQSNFSKCLLGFDQNLKPRDRCSITKIIKSISKSSYLTRLPKIFHQVLCKLIVPSYRGGHAYRLICQLHTMIFDELLL